MGIALLDIVDAGVSRSFDWAPIVIIISLTILVEMVVMLLMKYNPFKKSLLDSFLVNAVSLGLGYLLLEVARSLFSSYDLLHLLLLLVITIIVETGVLVLLNRKHPFVQTLKTCVVMNIASYTLFYFYTLI